MLSKTKPNNFKPKFEVVSCFCENNGEILLLQRQVWKPQGGKWGVPAGKKDIIDKTIEEAVERETREETGINIDRKKLTYFGQFFVRYDDFDFIYHIFHSVFLQRPDVHTRENEHGQYKWSTPKSAFGMDLIQDLDKCIEIFYKIRK